MRMNQRELRMLKEVRQKMLMEDASFRLPGTNQWEPNDTPAIREATRLWRETWIIAPLDELIAAAEKGASK